MSRRPLEVLAIFDVPGESPRVVHVDGHEIECRAVVFTVRVEHDLGGGCVNDSAEDRDAWRAEHGGRRAYGDTPEEAARAVLIR